ncbi:MAG: hypothetical protein U1F39_03835 [Steroidobacteraceae bacterium]
MQAVFKQVRSACDLRKNAVVIVPFGTAALQRGLEPGEPGVGHKVNDTGNGIGTPGGRGTACHHVDPLDQQLRELTDVGDAGDMGCHHALAINQDECAIGPQSSKVEGGKTVVAEAGPAVARKVRGACTALQRRQLGDRIENVGLRGLL